MTRRPLTLMAVGLAGLLALALWLVSDHVGRSRTVGPGLDPVVRAEDALDAPVLRNVEPERSSAAADDGPAPTRTVEPATSSSPASPTTLVCLVHLPDGTPVANARVIGNFANHTPVDGDTDAEGRVRFELDGAAELRAIEVVKTKTTTGVVRHERRALVTGRETLIELVVSRGTSLSGRVVDRDGVPVAGARVLGWCYAYLGPTRPPERAPDRTTTSAADGTFTVEHLVQFVLTAGTDDLVCWSGLRGELAPQTKVPHDALEIVVGPAARLTGVVLGAHGEPLEEASVHVDAKASWYSRPTVVPGVDRFQPGFDFSKTDADGRFATARLPSRALPVEVEHAKHLRWEGDLEPGVEHVVRLERAPELRGRVVSATGQPIAGADVKGYAEPRDYSDTKTDAEGRFALTSELDMVWVHAFGHAIHVEQPVAVGSELLIQLAPARALAGTVFDEAGQPFPGIEVEIEGDRRVEFERVAFGSVTTWEWRCNRNRTRTDEAGRFRFNDLYDGTFVVRALPPERTGMAASSTALAGDDDIELRFSDRSTSGVVLEGRVVDVTTGAPVTSFTVWPMVPVGDTKAGGGYIFHDTDGRFRVKVYEPGPITVRVKATGYARWTEPEREYAAGTHTLAVQLWPARNVAFTAVDQHGRRLPWGTRMRLETLDGRPIPIGTGGGGTMPSIFLHRDRAAQAADIAATRLVAWLLLPGETRELDADIDLSPERPSPIEIVVDVDR